MSQLDLARVSIRPFSSEAVFNRFSCGKRPVDQFLKNKAKKVAARLEQRVFCAFIDDSPNVIGYYALQIGSDSVEDLPTATKDNYLRNYTAFPAVNLSFIGVTEEYQRQGLGQHMLMDVFDKVCTISDCAGVFALTLVSIDEQSTAFYESLGFEIYSAGVKQPKMLYPVAGILDLVRNPTPSQGGAQ